MKKIFSNNRLIAIAFLTVFSLSAAASTVDNIPTSEVPVELIFTGQVNDKPVFELRFNGNSLQDNFTILISDDNGNSFYRENFKGENFTKKFLLNTDETGDVIRFQIFCNNTKKSVTYEINRNTKFIHEVQVNLVK